MRKGHFRSYPALNTNARTIFQYFTLVFLFKKLKTTKTEGFKDEFSLNCHIPVDTQIGRDKLICLNLSCEDTRQRGACDDNGINGR